MHFKKLTISLLILSTAAIKIAHANEVKLTVNKPMQVIYQLAYQDKGSRPVLSEAQTIQVNDIFIIPFDLNDHTAAGIVIDSVDGHVLPPTANQFNQSQQCSIATNTIHPKGELKLRGYPKKIECQIEGEMQDSALSS